MYVNCFSLLHNYRYRVSILVVTKRPNKRSPIPTIANFSVPNQSLLARAQATVDGPARARENTSDTVIVYRMLLQKWCVT
jgi:hypothetical protein